MKALTVRMTDELHEALRRYAFEQHISMNELIVESVAFALETDTLKKKDTP